MYIPKDAPLEKIEPEYMPKVGEWFTTANGDEHRLVGETSYGHFVTENRETVLSVFGSLEGAKPIKTEREQFIKKAQEVMRSELNESKNWIAILYDNGARFTDE